MARIVLAMSGGVDSSVAAHLLLDAGHDVIGVFMRHGETPPVTCQTPVATNDGSLPILGQRLDHKQGCCSTADAEDARRVAEDLQIPFYALNLEEDFGNIIEYFIDEYTMGRTPNPCVMCNHWIKFGKLFEYADGVGAEYVATGHYARLVHGEAGRTVALCRGHDTTKDQSYVLFGINPQLFQRMLLPIGEFEKKRIRELAASLGLLVADKRDSQEICFVTSGRHDEFVRSQRPDIDTSGDIVTTDGSVVGRHPGIERFTIGQRKRLNVALGEPRFVVRIEPDTRRVVIGTREELACRELTADRANWLVDEPVNPFRCSAQIRYNSPARPATVHPLEEGRFRVVFDQPGYGIAPGQAVVCYEKDRVLGGGWIV